MEDKTLVTNTGVGDQFAWQLRQWNSRSSYKSVTTGMSLMMKSILSHGSMCINVHGELISCHNSMEKRISFTRLTAQMLLGNRQLCTLVITGQMPWDPICYTLSYTPGIQSQYDIRGSTCIRKKNTANVTPGTQTCRPPLYLSISHEHIFPGNPDIIKSEKTVIHGPITELLANVSNSHPCGPQRIKKKHNYSSSDCYHLPYSDSQKSRFYTATGSYHLPIRLAKRADFIPLWQLLYIYLHLLIS